MSVLDSHIAYRDSHLLATRHSSESVIHSTPIGDFSSHFRTLFCVTSFRYFGFRTLVSVLWFSYFSIFHLPWICIVLEAVLFKTS